MFRPPEPALERSDSAAREKVVSGSSGHRGRVAGRRAHHLRMVEDHDAAGAASLYPSAGGPW